MVNKRIYVNPPSIFFWWGEGEGGGGNINKIPLGSLLMLSTYSTHFSAGSIVSSLSN